MMAAVPGSKPFRSQGLPAISEADLLNAVIELAHWRGWMVHHDRPARTAQGWRTAVQGDVGFPDLVLVRGSSLVFAELKSEKGKLTAAQEKWIAELRLHGSLVYVWKPSDWDTIERTLL